MMLLSNFKFLRTYHKPSCQTRSNAFLKSIKLWYRSCWCCMCFSISNRMLKICSVVLLLSQKPACSSARTCSAFCFSLFRRTISITLLGWLIKLMVLWFWQSLRFPFLGSGITSDWVHCFGHCLISYILWQITVNTQVSSIWSCMFQQLCFASLK